MSDDLLPAGRRIGHLGALAAMYFSAMDEGRLHTASGLAWKHFRRFLRGPELRRRRADNAVRAALETLGLRFYADGTIAWLGSPRVDPCQFLDAEEARDRRQEAAIAERLRPENQRAGRLAAVRRGLKVGDPDTKAYIDAVREAALEERSVVR